MITGKESFAELQADFYRYMLLYGGIARRTCRDYVTRMRFLAQNYMLDETLTQENVEDILRQEAVNRLSRSTYSYEKSISDFRACLNKFLDFIHSDYRRNKADKVLAEIRLVETGQFSTETERQTIIKARIGQGLFRDRLLNYWRGCVVSSCTLTDILVASHIKPWKSADNKERLDVYNGLLLRPDYDRLFDLGYISFDPEGKIMCSSLVEQHDWDILGIRRDIRLVRLEDRHKPYLQYHNEYCFLP